MRPERDEGLTEVPMADIAENTEAHRRFWSGEGPSLIFIPHDRADLYDITDYRTRFDDPSRMYASELARAEPIADWPTDGIPTIRPNLGTIFIPAGVGQEYEVRPEAMPWPGATMTQEALRARFGHLLADADLMRRALRFYELAAADESVYAYHADTQGVFDIAHILYGEELFLEMAAGDEQDWVRELLDACLKWYAEATELMKEAIGEPRSEMVHGHGTPQGLYFPSAGARISEDTATLLSPRMIEQQLLPYMERSATTFGGAFVHYCGKHDALFEMLCEAPWCRAIDLGNPEMYEPEFLAAKAAATDTVLYTRLPAEENEDWKAYVRRIGILVQNTGVRVVFRPLEYPSDRSACAEMKGRSHEMTERT